MKAGERYNNYDLDGNFISYLRMSNDIEFHVYDQKGDQLGYGKMLDTHRFNMYDMDGNLTSHGIKKQGLAYNLFDNDGDQIGYGNPA
ncbi:hypothetical protein [Ekhidna sp.]|uniref:hypothetical protein n=1 Tax=Ekhidna sp. TaxID=2608089 RepID=UPI003297C0B5